MRRFVDSFGDRFSQAPQQVARAVTLEVRPSKQYTDTANQSMQAAERLTSMIESTVHSVASG